MATSDLLQPQALKPQADMLASQGRFGDTQMVHMSMPEIRAIEARMGQELPLNPVTGVKEAFAAASPTMSSYALAGPGGGASAGLLGISPLGWAAGGLGITAAVLGGMGAERAAKDQVMFQNNAAKQQAQDAARAYEAMVRNQSSIMPYGMYGFDTGVAQPAVMGSFMGQGLGDLAQQYGDQIAANAMTLQSTQHEIDAWLLANPEPPVEIKRKSGFLGFGGKQWIDSSKKDAWALQKKNFITPRQTVVARLTGENQDLSVRMSRAELGELQGVSAPYQPMFTAGREALSDVFTGDMLEEELAMTDPVRIQRLRQAEAMIQAQKTGLAGSLNRQVAMNQAQRGYGGDSLFTNLARARTEGAAAQQAAATRMGAETANIGDVAALNTTDLSRRLNMRSEPFRQLGLEMEAKVAPQTYATNLMQDRLGLLSMYNVGKGQHIPMKTTPFQAIPSPGTLGLQSASNVLGGLGKMAMAGYGQQQATAAADKAFLNDAQLFRSLKEGDWGWLDEQTG
jgi:hypothetical protein